MDRQMRERSHYLLRAKHAVTRKIHYLQASADECLLLLNCEFDELILE
jgi:hypothetical protein